ncbi:translocase [Candidatus Daviesbacteria bacterium RIFCSPLOWO2_02_FULL_40_8]|nr:MAG: translocase [Candidatus Daviesbacteria bacterium RIFCSPLOWO2_02_FULL_40_8]
MLNNFGTTEILIVAFLVILFFGGKKIPEFIKGIGEAIKEFRKEVKDDK